MDVFSPTFLAAAAAARVGAAATVRQLPIFQPCVESDDSVLLLTRCTRPNHRSSTQFLLLLTARRLVVTRRSPVLHRLRLHLNTDLRRLSSVTLTADQRRSAIEITATAVDGVRERFWMQLGDQERVDQVEAMLRRVFIDRPVPALAG